jgi:hypothetical protein
MHPSISNFEERLKVFLPVRFEIVPLVKIYPDGTGFCYDWDVLNTRLLDAPLEKFLSETLSLRFWVNIHAVKLPKVDQSCTYGHSRFVYDVLDSGYTGLIKDRFIHSCGTSTF